MRIIKSQADLDLLKTMRVLPLDIVAFAQAEFYRLYEAYGQDKDIPIQHFHTDAHHCGHLVILENGDNVDDLSVIGLPGGFKRNIVEFVEKRFTGQRQLYRIVVLFDNDYGLTILFEPGLNRNVQFEAWLEEESDTEIVTGQYGIHESREWAMPF